MLTDTLTLIARKARRDSDMPLSARARKGVRYLMELGTARLYLRGVDRLGRHARTFGKPRVVNFGTIEIGDYVLLRSVSVPVELYAGPRGRITMGEGVRLNYGCSIAAESSITIGNRVRIGPYAWVVDTDFHETYDRGVPAQGHPVVIEDDAWIGAKASILKGVRIGRGAVVGTGSVVTRDVPPFTIVAGSPAKPVGTVDQDKFRPEDFNLTGTAPAA